MSFKKAESALRCPVEIRKGFKKTNAWLKLLCTVILVIMSMLLAPQKAMSWATFGTGTTDITVDGSNSPYYVDNVCAQVDNYSGGTGTGVRTATINSTYQRGTFVKGEPVMVLDMNQNYIMTPQCTIRRNYDLGIITGISGSNITITLPSSSAEHVVTGTKTYTIIYQIPQFHNVTLNAGGEITCHNSGVDKGFNGHIGGIIAFYCSGTLTFNGGVINGDELGEQGIPTGGIGGNPANNSGAVAAGGAPMAGNGASVSGNVTPYLYQGLYGVFLSAGCTSLIDYLPKGGDGGCGEGHYYGDPGGYGNQGIDICPANYNGSNPVLCIGKSGRGGNGGQGAGAGGAGGGGGAGFLSGAAGYFSLSTNGRNDGNPNTGVKGGDGGNGGVGGAAIYIKAYEIDGPAGGGVCVSSKGGPAGGTGTTINGNGKDGGATGHPFNDPYNAGGLGGYGGNGGSGGCNGSTMIPAGGGGGAGESGNGADGGNGGNGGDGGPIWIGAHIVNSFTGTNVSAAGGPGGLGGKGTLSGDKANTVLYGGIYATTTTAWQDRYGLDGPVASLCGATCGVSCPFAQYWADLNKFPTPSCNYATCSCDDVFRILSTMTNNVGGTLWNKPNSGNPGNYVTVMGNALVAYEFPLASGGNCSSVGTAITATKVYYCPETHPGSTFGCGLNFWNNIANPTAGIWTPPSNADWGPTIGSYNNGIVNDPTLPGTCEFGCSNGSGGGTGDVDANHAPRDGKDGTPGATGSTGSSNVSTGGDPVTDNSGDPAFPFVTIGIKPDISLNGLNIYPNPAKNILNIEFDYDGVSLPAEIVITDITGKIVYTCSITPKAGKNKEEVNLHALSSGVYMLSIKNEHLQILHKFNVQKD